MIFSSEEEKSKIKNQIFISAYPVLLLNKTKKLIVVEHFLIFFPTMNSNQPTLTQNVRAGPTGFIVESVFNNFFLFPILVLIFRDYLYDLLILV